MLSHFRRVQPFVILWTMVAYHTPLTLGFSRQEYWSGLPYPPPGDLPDPGTEPTSLALAGGFFTTGAIWEVRQPEHFHMFPSIPEGRVAPAETLWPVRNGEI